MKLSGYAATFEPYPAEGGPEVGGWMEQIDRTAAEEAVAETPRVPVKMGDVVVGEADLSVDEHGIKMDATLNVGYSFHVGEQQWSDSDEMKMAARRIVSMSLDSLHISGLPKAPDGG